jgi:SAM-dependent methyltransferase
MFPLFRSSGRSELGRRVVSLGRVFELDSIIGQDMGASQVAEYYDLSFGAYRRRHSSEGSLHLALNERGRFDTAGFSGQAKRLQALWEGQPTAAVLELGFGHGYNLAVLAPRLPGTRFVGVDITQRHVSHVQSMLAERGIANVESYQGDFHGLPWSDASFDHAYSIEAFCYARDLPSALAEAARVLRPGGTLTLYDGYLTRPIATMDADEALAVRLAAKAMAMDSLPVADELLAHASTVGFELERRTVLDALVAPNVKRLERLVSVFVRWPWLARRLLARLNPVAMRNVLAGYLMGPAMARGIWTYLELVLRKRS